MAMSKPVSFKKSEQNIWDFVKDKDFSSYVKGLIKKDMKETEEVRKPKNRKNINFDM